MDKINEFIKAFYQYLVVFFLLPSCSFCQSPAQSLTKQMVYNIVSQWYQGTNGHIPAEELELFLAEDVKMTYPNTPDTLVGKVEFKKWYSDVLTKYFDETHSIENCNISIQGKYATALVTVRWEAREWEKGKSNSSYKAYLSRQKFVLNIDTTGKILITEKSVQTFEETSPIYGPYALLKNAIIRNMFTSIVTDYPLKTENYYCKFFGFKRVRVYLPGKNQVVLINNGNSYIQIFPALEKKPTCIGTANRTNPSLPGGAQIAIQYAGISKISFFIDDIEEKINQMGGSAIIIKGLTNGLLPNSKLIWLKDPAGNTLELVQGYFDEINPPQIAPEPWNEKPIWR